MATMNISLPDNLKAFIDQQVNTNDYGSSSEYIRELVRRERDLERFRQLIHDGMQSPLVGEADDAYFDAMRAKIRDRSQT